MREPIDHASASELLGLFVRGEIEEDVRGPLQEHLDSCRDCSAELSALRMLYADAPEGLRPDEAQALRQRVLAELRPDPARDVVPARREPWWRLRVAQFAGAAALLGIVAVGIVYVSGPGGLDSSREAGTTADTGADVEQGESLEMQIDEDTAAGGGGGRAADAAEARKGGRAVAANLAAAPEPAWVDDAGPFTRGELVELARQGSPFVDFARFFTAEDAESLRRGYLEQLATPAPDPDTVRECTAVVLESQPYPILPAYGTVTDVDDRLSLVLGFVWTDRTRGPLDRFMVWAWRDALCNTPPLYQFGRIQS